MRSTRKAVNRMVIKFEFKPQDLWIGCYWVKHPEYKKIWYGTLRVKIDLWICLIPMLPIHLMLGKRTGG